MTRRFRDSLLLAFGIVTGTATICTVLGFSLKDVLPFAELPMWAGVIIRAVILFTVYCVITIIISICKYRKYQNEIELRIGKNTVLIKTGDIFSEPAWRVIGVDTHFDTNVDDVVISKNSLHGQLVLQHGKAEEINDVVKKEAEKQNKTNENGRYTFDLGTAIPYKGTDGHYVMVALTELDRDNEAHTKLPLYENTMMAIWRNLYKVYAKNDLALPILGSGITRFDDQEDEPSELLRCMLCTLNTSRIHFKTKLIIVIYNKNESDKHTKGLKKLIQMVIGYGKEELPLYEYKDLIRMVWKR